MIGKYPPPLLAYQPVAWPRSSASLFPALGGGNPEFLQNGDHRTPVRECRLKQVQPHKGGEQKPGGMHPVAQSHAGHDEKASDQTEITFDVHTAFLLRFTMKYTMGTVIRDSARDATSPAIRAIASP